MSNAQHKRMTTCYDEPEWTVITSDRQPPIMVLIQLKNCDTVAVTGEEFLQLIPELSRGFVDFFLIYNYTGQTTVFLEQASSVKND